MEPEGEQQDSAARRKVMGAASCGQFSKARNSGQLVATREPFEAVVWRLLFGVLRFRISEAS
jgi:hypothetical protein